MGGAFRVEILSVEPKIVASYNPARKLILFINESENVVYISKDPLYVKELGIPLYPFESLVFDVADADEPEMAFYAAATADGSRVRVYEALVG